MRIEAPRWASSSDLFIHVSTPGHIESAPDSHAGSIERSRPWFRYVTATVNFLVVDCVLIIIISFECQLGTTNRTLETTSMEEREILQWSNSVHLVHRLLASQTRAFVKICPVHPRNNITGWTFHLKKKKNTLEITFLSFLQFLNFRVFLLVWFLIWKMIFCLWKVVVSKFVYFIFRSCPSINVTDVGKPTLAAFSLRQINRLEHLKWLINTQHCFAFKQFRLSHLVSIFALA